jgi:hypothetical protein
MAKLVWEIVLESTTQENTCYGLQHGGGQLLYLWGTEGANYLHYSRKGLEPDEPPLGLCWRGGRMEVLPNRSATPGLKALRPVISESSGLPDGKKEEMLGLLDMLEELGPGRKPVYH